MAKTFTGNYRVKFPRGTQRKLIQSAKEASRLTLDGLAGVLRVHRRTLSDWLREKFSLSLRAARSLSTIAKKKMPASALIEHPYWYVHNGARRGGLAMYKKYGSVGLNPEKRLAGWRAWWEKRGRFEQNKILQSLPIAYPKKSAALAEFIGTVLGDGGITKRQVIITLHYRDDAAYARFVVGLIKKLFGVTPRVYLDIKDSVNNITISRSALVKFLTEKLGLKVGNKVRQQIDIPEWIKGNKKFCIACARGLVDTDGSVFTHTYKVKGKWYSYKKLDFTSMSKPLRTSMYQIFSSVGLHPRLAQNKSVRLDRVEDMKTYFRIIGSHNPKHLRRYRN
ncbi:MAG: hypothetical protein HYT82_00110 [Candidatus Harrisonbacteria bacterium]|nr:hypothetical protein [Candidatus Harrisonbacteria bacterium]